VLPVVLPVVYNHWCTITGVTSGVTSGVQSLAVVLGALDPVHGHVGGRVGADGTHAVTL